MMSRNNPRWGAPRIHGELLKLGIEITQSTVAKYMVRHRRPLDTENSVRIENAGFRSVREIIIVSTMTPFIIALLALVSSTFRTRAALQAETVALRHQIAVLQQSAPRRLRLRQSDRLLWIWLSHFWPGWRRWLRILKPDTVLRWHRRAFARYWTRKSRRRPGRPRSMVERRQGFETGMAAVECIEGPAAWKWNDANPWAETLMQDAVRRCEDSKPGSTRDLVKIPRVFILDCKSGLRCAVYILEGQIDKFAFAASVSGKTLSTEILSKPHQPALAL
jgi:hypothetical protein